MKKFLRPSFLIPTMVGFTVGIFVNLVTEFVLLQGQLAIYIFLILFGVVILAATIYWSRSHPIEPRFQAPIPIRNRLDSERHAHRGLIACVSLYTPQKESPATKLTIPERVAAAQAGDYNKLALPQSNHAPLIKAFTSHSPKLEHCWLISTRSSDGKPEISSQTYVLPLVNYLKEQVENKCHFYGVGNDQLVISMQDDILTAVHVQKMIQGIYIQAGKLGLSEKEIVVDITGGFRSIPLGMILASLDKDRAVEFVGTAYNEAGQPVGELFPILFSFEVDLNN